ncbi:hypothetical protein PRIPAC_78924 [Pristionchus pacificus]|uniref:Uncharacterized protein n=1 Tax=Pristionchus pacificus TaxID=54126 RepID=A0A2A6CND1_PRIPA|nr:hypothetical protein PRIPAC_78924 [Pristionchus pacificus]|eukprot:PDM79704.1 hypothetical protein PRIPAC_32283 [Pristionchus pacificus]
MSRVTLTDAFEVVNFGIGLILCVYLLFCLVFRTRQNLGTYRYFQITMVGIDVTYTTVQMFIREATSNHCGGCVRHVSIKLFWRYQGYHNLSRKHLLLQEMLVAYLALYNLTFVMIDYGFLYRMWAIKSLVVFLFGWNLFISRPLSPIRLNEILRANLNSLRKCICLARNELCCSPTHYSSAVSSFLRLWKAACGKLTQYVTVYFGLFATGSGRLRLQAVGSSEYGVDTTQQVMIMGDYFLASHNEFTLMTTGTSRRMALPMPEL